jgi:hypothetical protein
MPQYLPTIAAVALLAAGAAHADTIVTSQSSFLAAITDGTETTGFGLPYDSTTSSVTLADGNVLSTTGDEVAASGTGYAPFTNGYTGDILITNGASETITFGTAITALGLLLSPDVGLTLGGLYPSNATFTITLSNGQTTQIGGLYGTGDVSYVGFYGPGDITSMTISVSGTNALTGAPIPDFAFGDITSVPEPASLAVLGGGLAALTVLRRRHAILRG